MRGLWWEETDCVPTTEEGYYVTLCGDPALIPKDWTGRWRWHPRLKWPWQLFKVDLSGIEENPGYYVYFETDEITMRFRCWIEVPYFFARVGDEDVTFWAQHEGRDHAELLLIEHLGCGDPPGKWAVPHGASWTASDGAQVDMWSKKPMTRRELCRRGLAVSV